jgi:hypothetical protein
MNDQNPQAHTNRKSGKAKGKGKTKKDAQSEERIQRFDQSYSKKKRQTYFVPTPKSNEEPGKTDQASHVVLKVRRIICDEGYPSGTEIDIKSELLRDALADIFDGVEGLQLNETPPVVSAFNEAANPAPADIIFRSAQNSCSMLDKACTTASKPRRRSQHPAARWSMSSVLRLSISRATMHRQ